MTRKYLIVVALIGTVASLFFVWQMYDIEAKAGRVEMEILKELTAEDLKLVLASQPETSSIIEDAEARRLFLKGLEEYLALAAQARREGMAEDKLFRINFNYKTMILMADVYERRLAGGAATPYVIAEDEINAVWADPANEAAFRETMDAIATIQRDAERQRGSDAPVPKLAGEALEKARRKWARTKVLYSKAIADPGFANARELQLRLKILEAGILSSDYLRKYAPLEIRATEAEIEDYLGAHPELRESRKKDKAAILLSQILAGEDFVKLASASSEDRTSKEKGGLYEDALPDLVWPEVEKAALSLAEGEVYRSLVESNTGYHIVKLEKKKPFTRPDGSGAYKLTFRHILIQRAFEDPNHHVPGVPAPFVSPRYIATTAIETEKRDRFIRRHVATAGISVPADL